MEIENTQLFKSFDNHSRLMVEDTYDVEQEYSYVAGKNIMFEDDFKEASAQLAKDFSYWLNNNWFIPTEDGNWKQDTENIEYELSIKGIDKDGLWDDDELFELFNNNA